MKNIKRFLYKFILTTSLCFVMVASLFLCGCDSNNNNSEPPSNQTTTLKAKPVIFDTDFLTDVDDAVAIRILLWAEQHGMVDIVGLIVSDGNANTAKALSRFLDYEGRGNLPFAIEKSTLTNESSKYFDTIINSWSTGLYNSNDDCIDENHGEYYIKLLNNIPDGEKCNIICVGFGTALAGLMNRAEANPDVMNLVKTKVDKIYMMAGNYTTGAKEFNFAHTEVSRQAGYDICEKTPSEIPIVFLGFEIGQTVKTGGTIASKLGETDLLHKAISAYGYASTGRESWDPMTTLLAVYNNPTLAGYNLVQGKNSVNISTGVNTFVKNSTGNHFYVTKRYDDKYYQNAINSILEKNAWECREIGRVQFNYSLQNNQ